MGKRKRYAPRTVKIDGVAVPYRDYLQSSHWTAFKRRFRQSGLYKGRCYVCGSKKNLQFHHRTYKRVGRERLHDVIELCDRCHSAVHNLLRSAGGSSKLTLWTAARRLRKRFRGRHVAGPSAKPLAARR